VKAFDTDSWIDVAAAKAAGAGAIGGYLGHNLTAQVAADAQAANMGLWSFWEGESWNPDGGATQGTADATAACDEADQIAQPSRAAIYLPNDQVVLDWTATLAYFQAGAQLILARGRTAGFYGQTSVWEKVKAYGYKYFCHAPDGTPGPYAEAAIVQGVSPQQSVGGMTVDVDEIQAYFGGWNAGGLWPPSVVPPPKPDPPPRQKVSTMIIVQNPNGNEQYLICGRGAFHLDPADWQALLKAGVPQVPVSATLYAQLIA